MLFLLHCLACRLRDTRRIDLESAVGSRYIVGNSVKYRDSWYTPGILD